MKEKGKKESRTGQDRGGGGGLPLRTWHRTIDKNFTRGRHVFECVIDRERERGFTKSENHKKSKKSKKVRLKGVFSIEMEGITCPCFDC